MNIAADLAPTLMAPIPEPQILSGREAYARLYSDAMRELYHEHRYIPVTDGGWPQPEILQKHTMFGPRPITDMWAATQTNRARTVKYTVQTNIGRPMTQAELTEVTNIERRNAIYRVKSQIEASAATRLITTPTTGGYTNTGDLMINGTRANITITDNTWGTTSAITSATAIQNTGYFYRPSVSLDDLTISSESVSITVDGLSQIRYIVEGTIPDDVILNIDASGNLNISPAIDIKNSIRRRMRSNLLIKIGKKNSLRSVLNQKIPAQELKARETLREMISESDYRRYLTNGFIMVKAPSGLWYQIFGNGNRVKTYKNGKIFEHVCIHTDQSCPPTDHVINMKVLVELDEEALRKGANISAAGNHITTDGFYTRDGVPNNPNMTLLEAFKAMKVA